MLRTYCRYLFIIGKGEFGGKRLSLELTLHLLGLSGPADTIVGSPFVRGVSGGERHRVTFAEMISGEHLEL